MLVLVLAIGFVAGSASAQGNGTQFYVPLIGITSVPEPLALPDGAGDVTYRYAVKNFLQEAPLTNVGVTDDTCDSVVFSEGDDNGDGKLDFSETWRYTCTTTLSATTQSVATAVGTANNLTATHKAYTTVVVGQKDPAPLVSIINITKVAYPLTLPSEGGDITFTYRVNNPGSVPLSDVRVTDDKCSAMSSKLGDTNGNGLLDVQEVWIYTCTAHLFETTTNTVNVTAFAGGLKAVGYATITVTVDIPGGEPVPDFPDTGVDFQSVKITVWAVLSGVLVALILFFAFSQNRKGGRVRKTPMFFSLLATVVVLSAGAAGVGSRLLWTPQPIPDRPGVLPTDELAVAPVPDPSFGWKYPTVKFPKLGTDDRIAYSDIRDPGGIPQGLPVRLKIPSIGVDSAIEDALITPDGRMDVPAGSVNVAWFALGPHPGQVGSAVIGGHFGIRNGVPFVFYDLDKLEVGDKVYIVDDKNNTLAFIVRRIALFDRDADATTVFTSDDGLAHLNLITCEGLWNQVNDTYPDRRVVFTDAISAEEAAAPVPSLPPSLEGQALAQFPRSLSIGARGADVAALQTVLVQKGFLKIPSGVAKGYFGPLTRAAVANFQVSVGIPSNGTFSLATATKLISPQPSVAVKPVFPLTAITPTEKPITTITPTEKLVVSQSPTFVDGIVTSVLVLLILFFTMKIVRRQF